MGSGRMTGGGSSGGGRSAGRPMTDGYRAILNKGKAWTPIADPIAHAQKDLLARGGKRIGPNTVVWTENTPGFKEEMATNPNMKLQNGTGTSGLGASTLSSDMSSSKTYNSSMLQQDDEYNQYT